MFLVYSLVGVLEPASFGMLMERCNISQSYSLSILDVGDEVVGVTGETGLSGDTLDITPPKQLSVLGTFLTYFSLLHATAWVSLLYQAVGV